MLPFLNAKDRGIGEQVHAKIIGEGDYRFGMYTKNKEGDLHVPVSVRDDDGLTGEFTLKLTPGSVGSLAAALGRNTKNWIGREVVLTVAQSDRGLSKGKNYFEADPAEESTPEVKSEGAKPQK